MMSRHVPDDELHAYLDQALSRSQCVEIETHLAACPRCADRRDANAALRDRTTALLAQLTPRALIMPPPYAQLVERRDRLAPWMRWQKNARRAAMWAAGLIAAIGAGWGGRGLLMPEAALPATTATLADGASIFRHAVPLNATPDTMFQPVQPTVDLQGGGTTIPLPDRRDPAPRVSRRAEPQLMPAPVLQLVSAVVPSSETIVSEPLPAATVPDTHSPFDRIWRSVEWEEALQIAGSALPYIEGIPVVGVLVQAGATGERPTVIVAQQDASGEVIQTIEGPVAKVSEMLRRQSSPGVHASNPARTPPDYVDERGGGVRRAIRMLAVTGRLPVDSLNVLARVATIR